MPFPTCLNRGIKNVEFVICNTDLQALESNPVPNKLQIGAELTGGLGAGANPEMGRQAALESQEIIQNFLDDGTRMLFITAGMGGGTGTGAAPVIAEIARKMGILTVGIVTKPFDFEGPGKIRQADEGIKRMQQNCDTLITILNDKLFQIFPDLKFREGFSKADVILTDAAQSIAELITDTMYVNIDFQDVRTVMKDAGSAVMGTALARGEDRAMRVAEEALTSPLLNNYEIDGSTKILVFIKSGTEDELGMEEMRSITNYIKEQSGRPDMIWGMNFDDDLGDEIKVTIIATGFNDRKNYMEYNEELGNLNQKPIPTDPQQYLQEEPKQASPSNNKEQELKQSNTPFEEMDKDQEEDCAEDDKLQQSIEFGVRNESDFQSSSIELEINNPDSIGEDDTEDGAADQAPSFPSEMSQEQRVQALQEKKKRWREEAEKRRQELRGSNPEKSAFRQSNMPSFRRKNVELKDFPIDSEQVKLSDIVVTSDNNMLRNNFLNDNPD